MNTSHSLVQGSNAPWRRMGCVQLGQNSFVCSKHFSQFGICKMLDALLHSSWCELCALLAEGSQLSIWINTLSLSGNNAMLARWLLCFCKSMRVWAFSQAQLLALISEVAHRDLDSHHPYLGTKNGHHSCSLSSNCCLLLWRVSLPRKGCHQSELWTRISVFRFQRYKFLIQYSLTGMTDTVNSRGLFIIGSMYLPQADDCRWEKICCLDAKVAQTQTERGHFCCCNWFPWYLFCPPESRPPSTLILKGDFSGGKKRTPPS